MCHGKKLNAPMWVLAPPRVGSTGSPLAKWNEDHRLKQSYNWGIVQPNLPIWKPRKPRARKEMWFIPIGVLSGRAERRPQASVLSLHTQHWTWLSLKGQRYVVWETLNSTDPSSNIKSKVSPPGDHGSHCNSKDHVMIVIIKLLLEDFSFLFTGRFLILLGRV